MKMQGAEESDPKEPVAKERPLPIDAAPGKQPPLGKVVDEAYIEELAQKSLPQVTDFQDYLTWSKTDLVKVREQVLTASGVIVADFVAAMTRNSATLDASEKKLNSKSEVVTRGGDGDAPPPRAPLPGVTEDTACSSTFDANDLALRGRKAVTFKRYYVPIVFPDVIFGSTQEWRFGQKAEYRQEWRHEGFTLGPLVSSISLLPNEELTLEVSSWQRTKSEVSQMEESEEKSRQEREQRRTDEESVTNDATANEGWQVSASGSASAGPASASVSAGYSSTTSQRTEGTERHINEATRKATNEVSLKRAVKMTQTAEAGAEQKTVRKVKNPNACHTVTFNFFQVVKLFNVQLRLENDAPTLMLPVVFPAQYDDKTPVRIPYGALESFTAPANFITQFFMVDRDLSEEIHGWGLRVRSDALAAPKDALMRVTEALVIAVRYLIRADLSQQPTIDLLATLVSNYATQATSMRARLAANYGPGLGQSEQIMTPGIYADSLLGRCTACEDYVESSRYLDVIKQQSDLDFQATELERRQKRLAAGMLDPFEPLPPVPTA